MEKRKRKRGCNKMEKRKRKEKENAVEGVIRSGRGK